MFGHLVSKFPTNAENLATEALAFVLERSTVAREAMVRFGQLCAPGLKGPLRFRAQDWGDDRAVPDLVGIGNTGATRLIVEAKFDAGLTDHQPVTYLQRLPRDEDGLLLTVAPGRRQTLLWDELVRRVKAAGIECADERRPAEDLRSVRLTDRRTLAIASWPALLGMIGNSLAVHQDPVRADLGQLEGLCARIEAEAFLPLSSADLTNDVARRLLQYLGLIRAVTDELHAQGVLRNASWSAGADGWWGRYVDIEGWTCLVRLSAHSWATQAATPLWFQVGYQGKPRVTEAVGALAPLLAERPTRVFDRGSAGFVDVALFLPVGRSEREVVEDLADQMQRIVTCIRTHQLGPNAGGPGNAPRG